MQEMEKQNAYIEFLDPFLLIIFCSFGIFFSFCSLFDAVMNVIVE